MRDRGSDMATVVEVLDGIIRIRFVRIRGWAYNIVAWRGLICMPFTPTHAECVSPDGKWWVGQHGKGGMQRRPAGYDRDEVYILADGRRCEIIVSIPCTKAQQDEFYAFMDAAVEAKEPYDWLAAWTFLIGGHHHRRFASLCSSKVFLGFRSCKVFKWPVTMPAHEIEPAILLLLLSVLAEISH